MIHIDFQGGAHGNYLEFVCNKIAGIAVGMPFTTTGPAAGAAHNKIYAGEKIFYANHYSLWPIPFVFDKIISIQINEDDLLQFQQISLFRAGEYGYDNDQLEIDTYNKFNGEHYRLVLDHIIQSFFTNQIRDSYDAVKDPSWPEVTTLAEFENLPDWIKQECVEQHKLELLELSPTHPDCPRSVLREFFQGGFQVPDQHGLILVQQKLTYDESKQVYYFPYKCFYNKNDFLTEVKKIASWAGIAYTCQDDIAQLHDEFLQRQPYKNSKSKCDNIVRQIKNNKNAKIEKVIMLEEAYINAKLGWDYFK